MFESRGCRNQYVHMKTNVFEARGIRKPINVQEINVSEPNVQKHKRKPIKAIKATQICENRCTVPKKPIKPIFQDFSSPRTPSTARAPQNLQNIGLIGFFGTVQCFWHIRVAFIGFFGFL